MTGSSLTASFVYDGDGARVKSTVNGVTTYFVGSHYEKSGSTVTKYYYAGSQRIAMRKGGTLSYLLTDHLGSTSITTNSAGALVSELRYKPWGETRYTSGTTPTSYKYTGQREESSFGLYFYNARWYDPALGRFAQADSIVPGGVQGWDRYAAMNNNPVRYTDPSGHWPCEGFFSCIGFAATIIKGTAEYIKDNPINISKNLSVELPVVIPSGYGLESGIVSYAIDLKVTIRTTGRTIGDDLLLPLMAVGYLATVAPEQIKNYNEGATWNNALGDLIVDSGGFAASEVTGDVVGAVLIETGPGAVVGNFVGDIAAGLAWENSMEAGGKRQQLITRLGGLPERILSLPSLYKYHEPVFESPHPRDNRLIGTPVPFPAVK